MPIWRAAWVVPIVAPPIPEGAVAVAGGRIRAVGRAADVLRDHGRAEVRDLGPGVLLPGLVNAHCHLELSHLRGGVPRDGGFVAWTERVVALRGRATASVIGHATEAAIREVEDTGTAAVGDVSNLLAHVPALARSSLRSVVFHELIGWDPETAPRVMAEARARAAEVGGERPGAHLAIRPAAHAPWSVSPALFAALREEGGPAALHLAESREERRFFEEGDESWSAFLARRGLGHVRFIAPGVSPVRHVDRLGALGPALVAAHCVQTDTADHHLLAERGVSVAVCPRSNRNLGVGLPPVPQMMEAGVRLCLGTDSLASVETLDLMDDVAALHRAFPGIAAAAIIEAATRGGARALGFDDLGTLEPGRAAALSFAEGPRTLADPLPFLVSGEARLRPVRAAAITTAEGHA